MKTPTLTLLAALALAAAAPAFAQPKPATLQPAASEITFTTRQMGVPVEGRFTRYTAQIALDPRQPAGGSVALAIDTGSARFGTAELDTEVPKPTWLDVARFPQASFQSSSIKAAGPGRFDVAGKLTIKGAARDIVVPVQVAQPQGPSGTSIATGSFTIRRLEFKVGEGEWADTSMVANDIVVRFRLALAGLGPL